jgi:hypothetical protein
VGAAVREARGFEGRFCTFGLAGASMGNERVDFMITKAVLTASLWASAALAQPAPVPQRVFTFAQGDSPQAVQEIVNALRALASPPRVTQDFGRKTIAVQAPEPQASLAEWLFNLLDTHAPSGGRQEYVFPGAANDVVRVFYPGVGDVRQLQELVNALRSIGDIQRVTAFTPQNSVVIRGQTWQADLAEWLIGQLDNPANGQPSAAYSLPGLPPQMDRTGSGAVRIFYLPPGATAEGLQQTVNLIRTQVQVMRVVGYPAQRAIVLRGTEDQAAAAAQLVGAGRQ